MKVFYNDKEHLNKDEILDLISSADTALQPDGDGSQLTGVYTNNVDYGVSALLTKPYLISTRRAVLKIFKNNY